MPEIQKSPPEETRPGSDGTAEVPQPPSPVETESSASASGGGLKPKLGKLRELLKRFLDYIDEEAPAGPKDPDAPESKLRKGWRRFNSFLDALEVETPATERPADGETIRESACDPGMLRHDAEPRGTMLRKAGRVCRMLFLLGMILLVLFLCALFATIKTLDYIDRHRVRLYPSDEVMRFAAAEHETLEATAYPLTTVLGRCEDIPLDRFDAKCRETLKPLKIYSDEYGVYLMTSKDWYSGEHGIFIARDENNMPPALNWARIEGRVFAYGIFD